MLDDLVEVIEVLKERIATHGATLRENETRTRTALINPLLTALGWDVSDPALVTPEYRVGVSGNSPRADYALLDQHRNLVAAIEAKRLGESLENHEQQIFNYAWNLQIKYAGLTDGDRWYFVDLSQIASSNKTVLELSIASTQAHEAALKLLLLWRPNLASGQPVAANAPSLSVSPQPDIVPPELGLDPPPDTGTWISLAEVKAGKGQAPPVAVRSSGGEMQIIKNWWQVLAGVADGLVKEGLLTAADCPIAGLGFVNSSPVSPSGKAFYTPKQISGGLYLNVQMNSIQIVSCSKRLLSRFHKSHETVELRFE